MTIRFSPTDRHAESYRRALRSLINRFDGQVSDADFQDPLELLDAFDAYWLDDSTRALILQAIARMITGQAVENARSWREAARISTKGRFIYEQLRKDISGPLAGRMQELLAGNALLISSVPPEVRQRAAIFIAEETQKGLRAKEIARSLQDHFPDLSAGRLALIARTEASKSWTVLTQARAEDIGLAWYVWRTSKDARVRAAHRNLDEVIVSWNEAPAPEALIHVKSTLGSGNAGNFPNCRCVPEPLLDLLQVPFPARVYTSGRIVRLTQAQFLAIAGRRLERAA